MAFIVDAYGKVTVSLGGKCALACRHCYVMTRQFVHNPGRTPASVVNELRGLRQPFSTICVSGDTDWLLDETAGLELLHRLVEEFPTPAIMFTTRLVPSDRALAALSSLSEQASSRQQLLVPCVSLVTHSYPNAIELASRVPFPEARIAFMRELTRLGLPTILALRPTFPFRVVPPHEIEAIVSRCSDCATVALGEVFLLDRSDQIAKRLEISLRSEPASVGTLTFLDQPSIWSKCFFPTETAFTRDVCARHGVPYYLRSPTALTLLREHWSFDEKRLLQRFPEPPPENIFP